MRAIEIQDGALIWGNAETPTLGAGQVRIRVAATAINRADLIQASGNYPPPPGSSPILGLECAGEVTQIGEGVSRVAIGDRVCALLSGGGYAEEVVVPAGQVLPIPEGLDMVQAAALPEVFATAYLNLYMEAGLQTGERVIVHAGASGVGTAALQMLKQSQNPSFVTVGSPDKIRACEALGADAGHDRHAGSFLAAAQAWQGETGTDVILDPVGGQYLSDNLSLLGMQGRLVLIGLMGGAAAELNLGLMMMKRLRIIGSTLRARPIAQKAQVMDGLAADVWPALADGTIKPIIETTLPLSEAAAGHALVAQNETIGKVVLTL